MLKESEKMRKMKFIPFEQFIDNYNFIAFKDNAGNIDDTQIIRIYLCDVYDEHETLYYSDAWFEFGVHESDYKNMKMKIVKKIFSKEILNSYVTNFRVDDYGTLHISLSKEKEYKD